MGWDEFVNGLALYSDIIWKGAQPSLNYFITAILPALFDSFVYVSINIAPVILNVLLGLVSGFLY